jgi:OPA family glycerol-3-phosphate transporter-like MFS transporter
VLGYKADNTAYILTLFPIAGFLGTLAGGYVSDRFFNSRRAPICAIMFLGLGLSMILFMFSTHSLFYMMLSVGLTGFMLYGPDFLVSGISVMDFGSKEHASTAAGFVNGVGAIGAALTGIIAGGMANLWGWNSVFYLLVAFAFLCSVLISFMWNAVGKN